MSTAMLELIPLPVFAQAVIEGYPGRTPEVAFYLPDGTECLRFSIAVSVSKGRQNGVWEDREEPDWYQVAVTKPEVIAQARQILSTKNRIRVQGSLRQNVWPDKNTGERRTASQIYASKIEVLW